MMRRLLVFVAFLCTALPAMALPAHVQSFSLESLSVTSQVCTFPNNAVAGNLFVASIRLSSTSLTPTIADNDSNTWTLVTSQVQTTDGHKQWVWYAKNTVVTPNAKPAITFTLGGTSNSRCTIAEVSGLDTTSPLDQFTSAQGASNTPSSGNVTTTSANEYAWGGCSTSFNPSPWTAGSGYTLRESVNPYAMENQILSSTQTLAASCGTGSSGNWTAIIATFKAPGGGAPPRSHRKRLRTF